MPRLVVAALLALTLIGCQPTMELYSARFAGTSPAGVSMEMMVKVRNSNPFDVAIRNVRANVVLAQRYRLPTIQYSPNQWLGANQITYVKVPMVVPWQLVTPLVATTATSNVIRYDATCVADVVAVRSLGVGLDGFELVEEGQVSRLELLAAAARGAGVMR